MGGIQSTKGETMSDDKLSFLIIITLGPLVGLLILLIIEIMPQIAKFLFT